MKKIMIVAGGQWQVGLIKRAKEMGHFVINTNLYQDSPGFRYADECAVANVLDKQANLQIAVRCKPDAVLTDQSDIAVPTVAYLCRKLNLPGIGEDCARLFTNKYEMRCFCSSHSFPTPAFVRCSSLEEAASFLQEVGACVLKPLNSQSSRGVFTIRNRKELEACFEKTLRFTNGESAVLLEEYMQGTEFTVDGIKTPHGHRSLAISVKEHFPDYPMVASALHFSYSHPSFNYEKLRRQNDALVEAMGLPFGLTHAEYIYYKDDFYLVEIAARGGGSNISSHIVPCMSGVDNYGLLLRMALGQDTAVTAVKPDPRRSNRRCVLEFFNCSAGLVRSIRGMEELEACSQVIDLHINVVPGERYGGPTDDSKRFGQYIAWADGEKELEMLRRSAELAIKVEYDDGVY